MDREIVLLLAARLDAAQRAIAERAALNHPVTDRVQEARVLERTQAWAEELGLPRKLVEHLFRSLMEEGKTRFISGQGPPVSPVVTVLLAAPEGQATDLGGGPHPQLVHISMPR